MGNCLVAKLKQAVSNPNLPILGQVRIKMVFRGNSNGSIKTSFGTAKLVFENGDEYNIDTTNDFKLSTLVAGQDYNVTYISDYNSFPINGTTNYVRGISFDIGDFQYMNPSVFGLIYLPSSTNWEDFDGITGDITTLPESTYTEVVSMFGSKVHGDFGTFLSKHPNIGRNSERINFYNTEITGNVSDVGDLTYKPRELFLPEGVVGDFYEAIVKLRLNSNFTDSNGNGALTTSSCLCGSQVHLWSVYPINKSFTISWTATTSSITIDGVTTTFDNSGNIVS